MRKKWADQRSGALSPVGTCQCSNQLCSQVYCLYVQGNACKVLLATYDCYNCMRLKCVHWNLRIVDTIRTHLYSMFFLSARSSKETWPEAIIFFLQHLWTHSRLTMQKYFMKIFHFSFKDGKRRKG